jgi:ankyrin repeat protein
MRKSIIYLGLACLAFGNVSFANELTTLKTQMEWKENTNTPLCNAITKGDLQAVKKFIEYGVDVNQKSNGFTPLMLAARYNKVDILKVLIESGAKIDAKDENGKTALQYAILSNASDAVTYLKQV